jgi:hypothetical protein
MIGKSLYIKDLRLGTIGACVIRVTSPLTPSQLIMRPMLRGFLSAVVLAGLTACAIADSTDPTASPVRGSAASAALDGKPAKGGDKVLRRDTRIKRDVSVTRVIGAAGGLLWVEDAGLALVVPAGALRNSVAITVVARKGDQLVYEFLPHGLTFARPVLVMQDIRETSAWPLSKDAAIVGGYLANGANDVDGDGFARFAERFQVSTAYIGAPFVLFGTSHFSGYALASGRAGVDTVIAGAK